MPLEVCKEFEGSTRLKVFSRVWSQEVACLRLVLRKSARWSDVGNGKHFLSIPRSADCGHTQCYFCNAPGDTGNRFDPRVALVPDFRTHSHGNRLYRQRLSFEWTVRITKACGTLPEYET